MSGERHVPRDYIIFRRMSRSIIPGLGKEMVSAFAIGAIVGIVIFLVLGLITHQVTRASNYTDRNAQQTELSHCLYALKYEEGVQTNRDDPEGLKICEDMRIRYLEDYSDDEIAALAQKGRDAGLTSQTQTTELSKYVSSEITEQKAVVPIVWRIVIALIPAFGFAALFVEYSGTTLAGEILQRRNNRNSVKLYVYGGRGK